MKRALSKTVALGLLVAMAAGCGGGSTGSWGEDDPPDQCPPYLCGYNSNHLVGLPFFELELGGKVNSSGYTFDGAFSASGEALLLDIRDGRFTAEDSRDKRMLGERELVGARLLVSSGSRAFAIHILGLAGDLEYIDRPGERVPAYHLGVSGPKDVLEEINHCAPAVADDPGFAGFETRAVLLGGERLDAGSITVAGSAAGNWLYIGCEGSATYDAKLLGYDAETAAGSRYATTAAERQATYKMIMADYCGSGVSFTIAGEAVLWANDRGWVSFDDELATSVEAVWSDRGALCLGTPRLADTAPFIADMIAAECALPACDDALLQNWQERGYWVTYNP